VLNLRVLAAARDRGSPGPMASMLKIKGSELYQRIAELILEMRGRPALACSRDEAVQHWVQDPAAAFYLNLRKVTIYGGSNEIQRSIIAKHVLEL
jgi:alkylation response protein AidB-like acyl-CoA dehydrogenase